MKPKQSAGHDKLTNEHIKMGADKIIKHLTDLFNKILKTNKMTKDWKFSNIIILFQKGNSHKIDNYRLITLSLIIFKIFSKVIEKRIQPILKLNSQQPTEQAGFRKSFSK